MSDAAELVKLAIFSTLTHLQGFPPIDTQLDEWEIAVNEIYDSIKDHEDIRLAAQQDGAREAELRECYDTINRLEDIAGDCLAYLEGDEQYANAKPGLVTFLQGYFEGKERQQDGARELLAELKRLHEKTGWQSTADLLRRYR